VVGAMMPMEATMNDSLDDTDRATSPTVRSRSGLSVDVSRTMGGGVQFEGQDLNPTPFSDSEYEYILTVGNHDVPTIIEALGGKPSDDVLGLIEANIEKIVRTGELTWLRSLGISPRFWSHP